MALTIQQLAYALRLTASPTDAVGPGVTLDLTRMQAVAVAFVEADVATRAPETVRDEAQRLFVGYLYDGPEVDVGGAAVSYVDAWRQSGAQALLSRWRLHRAGHIGVGAAAAGGVAGSGLDRTALLALIDARIAAAAGGGNGNGNGMTAQQLADLQSSIDREGISISGRTIQYVDHEGRSVSIDVPGITVLDESTILLSGEGSISSNQVDELIFAGANVAATRTGNSVTVTVSGLSVAQVNALIAGHEDVGELAEFEAALRTETAIVTRTNVAVSAPNIASRVLNTQGTTIQVPDDDHDRELIVRVGTGLHHRVDVSTLRAKATATRPTTLDDSNSVPFTEGDDTFRLARGSGDDEILFSSTTAATYAVTITDSLIDLQPEARRSSAPLATTIREAIQAAVTGDVTLAADGDKLSATLKAGNIDPADVRFDAGTNVAGRLVAINDQVTGFEGLEGSAVARLAGLNVTSLFDGSTVGLAVVNSSQDVTSALTLFDPPGSDATFDLDDTDKQHGELHWEITFSISNRSSTLLGYGMAPAQQYNATYRATGIAFLSTIRGTTAFTAGGRTNEGIQVASVDMYDGAALSVIGKMYLYLAKNTNNELGYALYYDGMSGSRSWNTAATLRVNYVPSDAPAASGGGGGASPTVSSVTLSFAVGQIDATTFDRYHTPVITTGVPAENKIISMWYTGPFSSVSVRLGRPPSPGGLWQPVPDPGASSGTYEWKYARNLRAEFTGGGIRLTQTASTDGGNLNSRGTRRLYIEYLS